MSGISGVVAGVSGASYSASTSSPQTQNQQTAAPVATPAVIVSINPAATTPVDIGSADPNQVDGLMATVSAANGFADIYAHANWADFSPSQAAAEKEELLGGMSIESGGVSQASSLGVPISSSTSAAPDGTSLTSFKVSAFSFTNNGSTYTVTPGSNGMLNGTKDGQYWNSWQVSNVDANQSASAALQTLTAIASGSSTSSTKLDLSL